MAEKEHIILFPSLAQGHFIPFLALAAHLQSRNAYNITFVSTPLNIQRITSALPTIPNTTTTSITFAPLPFSSADHGLPPNCESSDTLPNHLSLRLLHASQSLQPAFQNLISQITTQHARPPLAIISDMFLGWTTQVARDLGIFHALFIVSGAFGTAVYFSLWLNLPHQNTHAEDFPLPDFPASIHRSQLPKHLQLADGSDACSKLHRQLLPLCFNTDGFLFNTNILELEQKGMEYFTSKANKPGWAIGPLVNVKKARKEPGVSEERCIWWLDLQPPSSVLYVSFGSQHSISAPLMMDLAMGLEACGRPFIWVIRPPLEFDVNEEFEAEWFPCGFEERITERKQGMLVWRWAPQVEILSHPSTGAFLSHCGWNSTIEGLTRGVPLMGLPLSGEQFYNVMMLVELGVCVEVARGNSAKIEKGRLERVMEVVLGGGSGEGEEMRKKVLQVKEMMEEAVREDEMSMGSSVRGLNDFLMAARMSRKANAGRAVKGDYNG
ncbi:hypothetical protein ACLOJK_037687 [Asimina triloba]